MTPAADAADAADLPPDLLLHLAAIRERTEFQDTLPDRERSLSLLRDFAAEMPGLLDIAMSAGQPMAFVGCVERLIYHCAQVWGVDCFERAAAERGRLFGLSGNPGENLAAPVEPAA